MTRKFKIGDIVEYSGRALPSKLRQGEIVKITDLNWYQLLNIKWEDDNGRIDHYCSTDRISLVNAQPLITKEPQC